ncbi:MAG: hypothetical protein HDQ99_21130 [Lachnospiraceae bacterium]|nr:hypothetical protein [Lachnospiraceae bacterium]MBD5538096.1 hypothetical protein [Lachnospiraceae bacterium]
MEISSNYSNYASSYANATNSKKQVAEGKETTQTGSIGEAGLSKNAQALLEKLRKNYSEMDFMVADFDKGDNAKEILSRGTKEVSVIFSSSELEKMASDEKYEQEYMERVQGAVRMSERINREFGFTSAFGEKTGNGEISKIGISFNSDGTTSFFAELEKSSAKQRERIEKVREEKRVAKKEQEKRAEKEKFENRYLREDTSVKRTTVQADSMEELLEKVRGVDWDSVKAENRPQSGGRFDFTI